jgi:signal transduction histidine kinase
MHQVFAARIPHIYMLYGLGFFTLGLAVLLELGRTLDSRFKRALRPLVAFGLVHGFHEWFEMFEIISRETYQFVRPDWLEWLRLAILAFSYLSLAAFGLQMLRPSQDRFHRDFWAGAGMLAIYVAGVVGIGAWLRWSVPEWIRSSDVWTRYALGIPGALLAAAGLLVQRRIFRGEGLARYGSDLVGAAVAFVLYGLVGQFVTGPSRLFPSTIINSERFLDVVGLPIELFRALVAGLAAVFIIRALRAFDVNRRRQLVMAQQVAQEAIVKRDALRGDLLRRSVTAQEEERRRLARELHDEIGQMLTGLAAGLRGVQQSLNGDAHRLRLQLRQLEGMTVKAIGDLSHLVADLRPSLLDDMGLHAALGWYVEEINKRGAVHVELVIEGIRQRLPSQVEIVFFRVTQESLTNVLRHAGATQVMVELIYGDGSTRLSVTDDGVGFRPSRVLEGEGRSGWGLAGIRERVNLAGGECHIQSTPGTGTTITVEIPLFPAEGGNNGIHSPDVGG